MMAENKPKIAITVSHLTKSFRIPLEASSGIKQKLINTLKGRRGYRVFSPLNDVSFDIYEGEFFGIVGRNGSGKSTLLKSIAGIYTPEAGGVHVNGRLVPFIELGVGFNPELNGRENVFLNGALLGFSHKEMEEMYTDIVDFAELHDFMEERLKNYSSGMQVRLAFSIAIRAKGDILLLDEVLAVGDESFQRKCYDYFAELKREKKTVVLVTHSMSAVEAYCTRAMFIDDGEIREIGDPVKIAAAYSRSNDKHYKEAEHKEETTQGSDKPEIIITINDKTGRQQKTFVTGEEIRVSLEWERNDVKNAGVSIFRKDGQYVYGTNTYIEDRSFKDKHSIAISIIANLSEGSYFVKAGIFGDTDQDKIDLVHEGPRFVVNRNKDDYRWNGITKLKSEWQ